MNRNLLENFVVPIYNRTPRNQEAYQATYDYCSHRLQALLDTYRQFTNNQQTLRLIRDDIDNLLRRYHEYCIRQRDGMGAHYVECGVKEKTDFEHLIPAARVRDLLIVGVFDIVEALNCPTVKLSYTKHQQLKEAGWASQTPDMWLPFQRYAQVFSAQFQTYDGTPIDPDTWTLQHHYDYFQHLVIERK